MGVPMKKKFGDQHGWGEAQRRKYKEERRRNRIKQSEYLSLTKVG